MQRDFSTLSKITQPGCLISSGFIHYLAKIIYKASIIHCYTFSSSDIIENTKLRERTLSWDYM